MNVQDSPLWQEALAHVPGIEVGAKTDVQALAGGTTNATFRVGTALGRFVLRLHEPYSLELGIDRRREAILHAVAAGAGLASPIIAADPQGRFLIAEYLPGETWSARDLEDDDRLQALVRTLVHLHSLPAPVVAPLDVQGLLEGHARAIAVQDPGAVRELEPQLAAARDTLARVADADRRPCIVHGDLSHTNMIGAAQPRLIDWEYAAVADPLMDLACLAAYYPQVLGDGTALLRHCGLPLSVGPELADLARVYGLLSNLWYRRLALARRHLPPAH